MWEVGKSDMYNGLHVCVPLACKQALGLGVWGFWRGRGWGRESA